MDLVIVLCIARLCMLEIVACWRTFFPPYANCMILLFYLCNLGGVLFILICCDLYRRSCPLWLKCVLIFRAEFACEKYLAWLSSKQVQLFFVKLESCFSGTWNISSSVISQLSTDVPNHFPLFWYWGKKNHTQSRSRFVLAVSVLLKQHCLLLLVKALPSKHLISCCQRSQSLSLG